MWETEKIIEKADIEKVLILVCVEVSVGDIQCNKSDNNYRS